MNILLDVDGALGDFVSGAHQWAREIHGVTLPDEQITDYNIMTSFGLPNGWPSFIEWLSESAFCWKMPAYDGAAEFVDGLRKFGRVIAVTTPFVGVSNWEADRRRWLEQHFGFDQKDLVFCKDKSLVRGHVLIDDKLENCEAFAGSGQFRDAIVFDRPWNRSGKLPRARGYAEALAMVEGKL